MLRTCQLKRQRVLNPIIDWSTEDVWEFIHEYNIPYCSLYDEGFTRLGCIGCPMGGSKGQIKDFKRYPKYKELYLKAFEKMIKNRVDDKYKRDTPEKVMEWWLGGGYSNMEEQNHDD